MSVAMNLMIQLFLKKGGEGYTNKTKAKTTVHFTCITQSLFLVYQDLKYTYIFTFIVLYAVRSP